MSKYTAEQVRACILAYKNGDLNYCRSGIVDLLTEYAAILDAEGDGGAVAWRIRVGASNVWGYCKNESEADFYGKRSGLRYEKQALYLHPARSGVVSDADVEDAARWRFFCDNIGRESGDGYTEPRENYASLEWQQGPWIYDGSNDGKGHADFFPGWSAIIDELMEEARLSAEEESVDATQEQSHD